MDEKHNCLGIYLRKLSKVSWENSKKCIILADSQQNLKAMRWFFARLAEKYKSLGNFEKILKIIDENSIEKLNFSLFLEKLWLKIEPSEIASFFYNNLFQFRGGDVPSVPPTYAFAYVKSFCYYQQCVT